MLLIAIIGAHLIGRTFGWWGPFFSPDGPIGGSSPGLGRSGGGSGSSGRASGRTTGSSGVRRAGTWLGNASGWNDARRDARAIHDRDEPPVTWGEAWREGWDQGKTRGRERFDAGQGRKAERIAARQERREARQQAAGAASDEAQWGPPQDAAPAPAPTDEVAEKRRERDDTAPTPPEAPAPVPVDTSTSSTPPAPTGDEATPEKENTVTAPTAPAAGEMLNFDSARCLLRTISADMQDLSDAAVETAARHRGTVAACDAAIEGLTALDADSETIGELIGLREQARQALEAAERAQVEAAESSSFATVIIGNIDARHGAIEEAVRSAKHAAKREAYLAS